MADNASKGHPPAVHQPARADRDEAATSEPGQERALGDRLGPRDLVVEGAKDILEEVRSDEIFP